MTDDTSRRRPALRYAAGLIAAGAVVGGIAATALSASADNATTASTSTVATTNGTTTTTAPQGQPPAQDRSSTPVRSDEKAVSADVAAKLKAAALKAVPGGTVYRVETDADGATYEAHMTKADGTEVTVKFDASFKVTGTEAGHGAGGPGGPGGHMPPNGTAPGTAPGTSSNG
jgi:uncharacterized membrane protein YkoI